MLIQYRESQLKRQYIDLILLLLWIKTQSVKSSCIGVIQENSIEFLRQSNLPYIL